jgi:hypothetical protein
MLQKMFQQFFLNASNSGGFPILIISMTTSMCHFIRHSELIDGHSFMSDVVKGKYKF